MIGLVLLAVYATTDTLFKKYFNIFEQAQHLKDVCAVYFSIPCKWEARVSSFIETFHFDDTFFQRIFKRHFKTLWLLRNSSNNLCFMFQNSQCSIHFYKTRNWLTTSQLAFCFWSFDLSKICKFITRTTLFLLRKWKRGFTFW